ncbi:hypothetical protein ACFSL6_20520 [Paenibacillus thailandensis]|uniref:Uncharacterized protein n=1 Tax=Paenibacillus thailandensis TaxID=393250 RepID=A0ABW5QS95_9BACL
MTNEFYCVGCGKMVGISKASIVFKTGFFRNTYSLGCCEACSKGHDSEAERNAGLEEKGKECLAMPAPSAGDMARVDVERHLYECAV